jgi:ribosome biogenesis GTPase
VFLAVGDLNRIGRGKHTTTAVTLIKLPAGGRLADTPGFSQPALEGVSSAVSSLRVKE